MSNTNTVIDIHDADPLAVEVYHRQSEGAQWISVAFPQGRVNWFTDDPRLLLNAIIHQAGRELHRLDAERYGATDGEVTDSGLPTLVSHVTTSDGHAWGEQ